MNYATTYGRLRRITEPTFGNHEWFNRRTGFLPYWRKVKGRAPRLYYSFKLAGWQFLDLNSEAAHGKGSAQLGWLRKQLAAARAPAGSPSGTGRATARAPCTATPRTQLPSGTPCGATPAWC